MRLTLRTLLAYLDDRLSPTNARELGQKIAQSPFATELAERIREVVRKRRLAAPAQSQKMLDPNLLAEYLDDLLTPELVALIEREVLASDYSLAEVAATHQILGLLGDPVPLENRLSDRLYALNPNTGSDKESASDDGASVQPESAASEEWSPLTPQATVQKSSPMIILLAMMIAWLALIFTDSDLIGSRNDNSMAAIDHDAAGQQGGAGEVNAGADVPEDAEAAGDGQVQQPDSSEPTDETTVTEAATDTTNNATGDDSANGGDGNVVSQPGGEGLASDATEADAGPDTGTDPKMAAVDDAPSPETNKPDGAAGTESNLPQVPSHRFILTDPYQMTLLCNTQTGEWSAAQQNGLAAADMAAILKQSVIGVSEPFRANVSTASSGWRAMLLGPALAEVADGETTGVRVLEGRVILRNDPTQPGQDDEQIGFQFRTATAEARLTLSQEDSVIGIEVTPIPRAAPVNAVDAAPEPDHLSVLPFQNDVEIRIYVAEGDITIDGLADGEPVKLGRGRALSLLTTDGLINVVEDAVVQQLGSIPDWVYSADRKPVAEVDKLQQMISDEFAESDSVSAAAMALCENRNLQVAQLATHVLSVTRSLDDLAALVLSSDSEPVRRAAIDGLHRTIWQDEANAASVLDVLETRLPGNEVGTVFELLRGISIPAAQDPDTSLWLIDLLNSDRVATRELAIYNIEMLTGERQSYVADSDSSRRRDAVRRWQRFLERNGGVLVKPE